MSSERTPAGLASLDPWYEIIREIGQGGTAVVYAWDARGARWRFLARLRSGESDGGDPVGPDPPTGVPSG